MKLKPLNKFSPQVFVPVARAAIWQARVKKCKLKDTTLKRIWKYRTWIMDDLKRLPNASSIRKNIQNESDYELFEAAWDDLRNSIGALSCYELRVIDLLQIAERAGYIVYGHIPIKLRRSTLTVGRLIGTVTELPDPQGVRNDVDDAWKKISSIIYEPNAEPLSDSRKDRVDTLKSKIVDLEGTVEHLLADLDVCEQDMSVLEAHNQGYENMLRAEREASAKLRGNEDQYRQEIHSLREFGKECEKTLRSAREANGELSSYEDFSYEDSSYEEAYQSTKRDLISTELYLSQLTSALQDTVKELREAKGAHASALELNDKLKAMLKAIIEMV